MGAKRKHPSHLSSRFVYFTFFIPGDCTQKSTVSQQLSHVNVHTSPPAPLNSLEVLGERKSFTTRVFTLYSWGTGMKYVRVNIHIEVDTELFPISSPISYVELFFLH